MTSDRRSDRTYWLFQFDRQLGRIEYVTALVSGGVIFFLMMLGITQVLGRKLFNVPIFGYIDIVELAMIVFALLPIAYCQQLGGHVRMEILIGRLGGRPRYLAEFSATLIAIAVVGTLGWYGFQHGLRALTNGDTTIDAEYVTWPWKMLVPFAFAVLLCRLTLQAVGFWRLVIDPKRRPVAVPTPATVEDLADAAAREAAVDESV